MAVKFSDFTEATDSASVEKIVGYTSTGDLNLQIPPANLDTTYVVSTTDGTAPIVNLTATKAGSTPASSLLNFTGSGATTLTGNASTSTINISSDPGVTTFTNANGTYISAGTVNTAASGAVTVGAIDLNAIDGSSNGTTRFLSKDNTWDVPSYSGGAGVYLPLAGGTMTGNLDLDANNRVLFGTANDLQIYHSGAAKISNSTGQLDIESTDGITLAHAAVTKLATATTGITITGKATSTATVAGDGATTLTTKGYVDGLASDVTSVNSGTPFDSTGAPLAISPTSGAVIVSSAIYNGGTNIGVVPGGGAPTTFLKGDGSWAVPTNSGGTVTSVGLSTDVAALTVADTPVTSSGTLALNKNGGTAGQYIDGDTGAWTDLPAGYTQWSAISDQGASLSITDGTVLDFNGRVASDGAYGSGLGLGAGIYTDTAINTGEVTTGLINNGGTPSATTFYRGDGNWATVAGGYTTEFIGSSTTVSAVKDYLYILANPSAVTITLPASPADGDTIGIANNFFTSGGNVSNVLAANGSSSSNADKIMGDTSNLVIDNGSAAFDLVFSSAGAPNGNGWTIVGGN
mgnify:CR=1 FL=1|tara:strand:+ start:7354 stop:9078 length:1725 start_codon:yes stop_codon:yes gene_type:complete